MRIALLIVAVAVFLASGCATEQAAAPPASLPDGRALSEHPLDVLSIPQP